MDVERGHLMIPKKPGRVFIGVAGLVALLTVGGTVGAAARSQSGPAAASCDPVFAELFTPRRPVLGRYEACTDPRPLADIAPADWVIEALEPADAFGGAGSYDHAALARLYGGRRARVARGWTETADRFEAVTLISPHPNATVTALEPGTLIIRWICDRGGAECKMVNAGR
jgi:hypothetical protein